MVGSLTFLSLCLHFPVIPSAICGLSLSLVTFSAPRGFSLGDGQFHMRNVKIIVFKTVFLIELLLAVHCRHVKVYCKMFFIALGKTALRGGHKVCMC